MVLDAALLSIQHYKARIKGKVEKFREWSNSLHLGVVAIKKGAFGPPSTTVANFTFICLNTVPSYLPNPSARAGYDTRLIFKWSLTGLNSEFSFS